MNNETCPHIDHNGVDYGTNKKMCEHYGISVQTFGVRFNKLKWPLKCSLLVPLKMNQGHSMDKITTDPWGKKFSSLKDMLKYHNCSADRYYDGIKRGDSLKDILSTKSFRDHEIRDSKGNSWKSAGELARYLNADHSCIWRLLKTHSVDEIIQTYQEHKTFRSDKICYDHKGNQYQTEKERAAAYGLSRYTVSDRLERGWTLEEALTESLRSPEGPEEERTDHKGIIYPSIQDMCKAYNMSQQMYQRRINVGLSKCLALTLPKYMSLGEAKIKQYLDSVSVEYVHNRTIKSICKEVFHLSREETKEFIKEYTDNLLAEDIIITIDIVERLRFDFTILKGNEIFGFIEFDGRQHFKYTKLFHKTIETFFYRKRLDDIKTSLCAKTPLLRIRFDQIDRIDEMVSHFLAHPEEYIEKHNLELSEEEYWKIFSEDKVAVMSI